MNILELSEIRISGKHGQTLAMDRAGLEFADNAATIFALRRELAQ